MDIGIFRFAATVDDVVAEARTAADQGFGSLWMPQIFGLEALTGIAIAAREVPGLRFGTAVVPTYRQHPMALAQQALTTSQASGGRLTLGIGLSHQIVVEGMWGLSFDHPLRHMREYLEALVPLLAGEPASVSGESITARGAVDVAGPTPELLVAALGPRMLELAGRATDGTITWMVGPTTLASHVVPTLRAAADAAGRPAPTVATAVPACVTDDPEGARERVAAELVMYGQLPSYRAMLDREGVAGPEDIALVGSAQRVADGLGALLEAGATTLPVSALGTPDEQAATREVLVSLL